MIDTAVSPHARCCACSSPGSRRDRGALPPQRGCGDEYSERRHHCGLASHRAALPRRRSRLTGARYSLLRTVVNKSGRPEQFLPLVHQPDRPGLDVDVQPLLDDRLDVAASGVGEAQIELVKIAAASHEVQLVGSVRRPLRLGLLLLAPDRSGRRGCDLKRLIGEAIRLHLHAPSGREIEDFNLRLRDVRFVRLRFARLTARPAVAGRARRAPPCLSVFSVACPNQCVGVIPKCGTKLLQLPRHRSKLTAAGTVW